MCAFPDQVAFGSWSTELGKVNTCLKAYAPGVTTTSNGQLLKDSLIPVDHYAIARSMDPPNRMHNSHTGKAATGCWPLGFGIHEFHLCS